MDYPEIYEALTQHGQQITYSDARRHNWIWEPAHEGVGFIGVIDEGSVGEFIGAGLIGVRGPGEHIGLPFLPDIPPASTFGYSFKPRDFTRVTVVRGKVWLES